jgi:hypothetical protein
MKDREERVAQNESISREINEGLEQAHASSSPGDYLRIVCECGQEDCPRLIAITTHEYEDVRSDPRRFAVAKDHVMPDIEQVLRVTDRFAVVQKREGIPAAVAEEMDPRT